MNDTPHISNDVISYWFTRASLLSEHFLEAKLDALGAAVREHQERTPLTNDGGTGRGTAFFLDGSLRALPDSFIDDTHEFVSRLYLTLPDGYSCANNLTSSRDQCNSDLGNNFLYGEVTSEGVRQLDDLLGSVFAGINLDLIDLGSGTGRMIIEMAHLHHGPGANKVSFHLNHAYGIELEESRADVANLALEGSPKSLRTVVTFLKGDFLSLLPKVCNTGPGPRASRSFLFCCGVGFGKGFVKTLLNVISDVYLAGDECLSGDRPAPEGLAGCLFLFRDHPMEHIIYQNAKLAKRITLSTTWMNEAPAMLLVF